MLLNDGHNGDWKLINYRSVGDLITAEFLHDLYNQAEITLNPVHFRNTVCVVENGMFKSYAPQSEWDTLAEVLGNDLIRNSELRQSFSKYLERSQDDLTDFITNTNDRYTSITRNISHKDIFYDLSKLHFLALDKIYAINLVQFEHALGYAIDQLLGDQKEELDRLLKSTSLTVSGQEELKALQLSILVSEKQMSVEEAAEIHKKEFSSVNLAYGATQGQTDSDSYLRIVKLSSIPLQERHERIQQLQSVSQKKEEDKSGSVIEELTQLAKKLGERRDKNKALMGRVAESRKLIMDHIAITTSTSRDELSLYFLNDIFNLLIKHEQLSKTSLEERRNRIVLQRQERATYGVEAIQLSEQAFPNFFKDRKLSTLGGIVASSGKITGRIRKVYSIEEARQVKKDEIMVAFGTDFDLMIGLQNCAGVITEEGGLLSHASVISRELGKPCLINVKNAMSILQDGYLVELDTKSKNIDILDKTVNNLKYVDGVSLLTELPLTAVRGAKAKNLHILTQAGFPVLPAVLAQIDEDQLEQIAESILLKLVQADYLSTSCIVRSNSTNEDTAESSMAGQYTSVVCQTEKKLLINALRDVLHSYNKPKIKDLSSQFEEKQSVLVQPYYPQQYGGVAFSHHPVDKKEGVIIEASQMGAGAVVEGKEIASNIPQEIEQEVSQKVSQIQKLFGQPMDVEWGFGEDGIKIFQARPIVFKDHYQDNRVIGSSRRLIVIAGGQGSRIKEMFSDEIAPFTKHFLPLPEKGGSIIGSIIEKSRPYFDVIELSGSHNTLEFLKPIFSNDLSIEISEDNAMIGPLYPPFKRLLSEKTRVHACCGDIYSNFNWDEMEAFHNKHGGPVTILIAKSFPAEKAACFSVDEHGCIYDWERKKESTNQDLINIGAYIFDPDPKLDAIANNLVETGRCKEDLFFQKCIEKGILHGYVDPDFSCNINIPSVYHALVRKITTNDSVEHVLRKTSELCRDT